MILLVLAYLGGVLTILSPCILPVLPFVFARAGQPFLRSGLPMLCGMVVTFAVVATLAAVGGGWAVQANQYGRFAALLILAFFGVTLVFPALADRLARPLVAIGARLSQSAENSVDGAASLLASFLLGIATGLLWAPCAGPILGLVLTGAALQGANIATSLLLLVYAAGAATSLAIALLVGGRVFVVMKKSLGAGEWVRRGLGIAVLAAVVAIALGLDTGLLTRFSLARTGGVESALVDAIRPRSATAQEATGAAVSTSEPSEASSAAPLPVERIAPSLDGAVEWLNSKPLTAADLRGKVVLVDFWTYSCINCLRALPYVRAWAEKYKNQGLVVIGVHAPEFAFEKDIDNVRRAAKENEIAYPVAIDNGYVIWRAFQNEYWPAHYLIDAQGRIRHHHFGEGKYDESERVIQQLLAESGRSNVSADLVKTQSTGAQLASDLGDVQSPETYVGYARAANFASAGGQVKDAAHAYIAPVEPARNQWGLAGNWSVGEEKAVLVAAGGSMVYRFHARDLHLVLAPGTKGQPVRFRVTIDGAAPGQNHGTDADSGGNGVVTEQRLYQLIRSSGEIKDHTFHIQFLDPGAQAFAFTFG
ncbi:MAG: cytochrome c biogenesis protein DipZ [Dokdonella sp.]